MRRQSQLVIGGVILFALGYYRTVSHGLTHLDESWFLQVLHRVTSGEVLYRDVFFGVTPLSVYLALPFVQAFGSEILVVKGLAALCFVGTVFLCCRIARQLNAVQGIPVLLVLALLHYAPPSQANGGSLYSPVAIFFLLCCLNAVLSGWQARSSRWLMVAGLAGGLCFAAKQNMGVYTLGALLAAIGLAPRTALGKARQRRRSVVIALTAFLLVAILLLLPVWVTGGGPRFLEYGFLGKGDYLRMWRVNSYWKWLWQVLTDPWPDGLLALHARVEQCLVHVLPPVVLVSLAGAWVHADGGERPRIATVLGFVLAAVLIIFPNGNAFLLAGAVPLLLVGLVYAWSQLKVWPSGRPKRLLAGSLYLWLGLGVGLEMLEPISKIAAGESRVSAIPHFRGLVLPKVQDASMRAVASVLPVAAGGEATLLLSLDAAPLYLLSGLQNPTPYDYPIRFAFGLTGEADTMAAIANGTIRQVCLGMSADSSLHPRALIFSVVDHMQPVADLLVCTLYRSPQRAVP